MRTSEKVMRVLAGGMTALFVVWAYYQRNDPDPILWVGIYAVSAIACLLFVFDKLPNLLVMALGMATTACGIFYLSQPEYGSSPLILIEEWREGMGLLVIAAWMAAMFFYQRKQSRAAAG